MRQWSLWQVLSHGLPTVASLQCGKHPYGPGESCSSALWRLLLSVPAPSIWREAA